MNPYLAPFLNNHPLAKEWNDYLAVKLDFSADDFPDYAWQTDIPDKEYWEEEVQKLNEHMESL
jgi:hypothetical protein